ncbi:bone morphogenetic protein 4 [Fopius arisanus]|uniref:BMP4 protein n=2 Tax=Fopius arisanus TaxID=64838 RepID=A0A0C9RKB5_9HYME|nr:PREDICTED: bone morphogenetic protein 4 [Fopius arisanus]
MGEDSIILPIDRVICEEDDRTRFRVERAGKFVKFGKRKINGNWPIGKPRTIQQLVRAFIGNRRFVIFIGCALLLGGCYLGFGGQGKSVRMQGDFFGEVQLREDEIETIRRSIVEGLGMQRIPDPSKANVSQTEYERAHVEYLRRLQMSRAPGDRRRRRLHTFHATEEMDVSRARRDVSSSEINLYFPLDLPEDEEVDHATLRLVLEPGTVSDELEVSVYRIEDESRHWVSSARFTEVTGARWIELDVTELVVLWHEGAIDNLGMDVGVKGSPGAALASPYLNVLSTTGQSRRRRSATDHLMSLHKGRRTDRPCDTNKCCRHEMTVIFKDLRGFDFIIQPKTFDAGYCKGRCPPRFNPAHHHALLQSLIWKENKRKVPRPCCAPSKLSELEILYFDESDSTKLKVASWKNMKVLECACS